MDVINLFTKLLKFQSVTPHDDGALAFIASELNNFEAYFIHKNGVKNLLLTKQYNDRGEHLAFGGHIDVVPAGNNWQSNPFEPLQKDDFIYARGAQDMKSGVAAFIQACKESKFHGARLSIILTSDEEGEAKYGTLEVLKYMKEKNILPDFAIVAEPTCVNELGDSVKIGRRGSINGILTIQGKQGHVAYPEKCINPIHDFAPLLQLLAGYHLDNGNDFFAPSQIIITDIRGGMEVCNVTPNALKMMFNIRNNNQTTQKEIQAYIQGICKDLQYDLQLLESSKPFLTNANNKIIHNLKESIQRILAITPELNTKGGTSDARYFAEFGVKVAEFGVCNDRIHAVDERVKVSEVRKLYLIFKDLIENF